MDFFFNEVFSFQKNSWKKVQWDTVFMIWWNVYIVGNKRGRREDIFLYIEGRKGVWVGVPEYL